MELPPVISESWRGDSKLSLQLALEPELNCFQGHFEGAPVLAGVIQLGWVVTFAEQKFQHRWHFRGLRSAKFQRLILPPVTVRLDIEYLAARQLLKFKYSDAAGAYSSGGISVEIRDETGAI